MIVIFLSKKQGPRKLGTFTDMFKEVGIGDTVFTRSRNIEKLLGFSKLWLKFEAGNPTGTMKDRASYATLCLAKDKGYGVIAVWPAAATSAPAWSTSCLLYTSDAADE